MAVQAIVEFVKHGSEAWQLSGQQQLHLPYKTRTEHKQDCAGSNLMAGDAGTGYAC